MRMENGTATWGNNVAVSQMTKQKLTVRPSNSTSKYPHPREMQTYVHMETCMWMFISLIL